MAPVARVRAQNTTPISADAAAMRSQVRERVRGHRYRALAAAVTPTAR